MCEVEFNHNGNIIIIQGNKTEKMKEIIKRFLSKINLDRNTINFIYAGNTNINDELTFEETANQTDKIRNKMNILVNDIILNKEKEIIKKSKNVICPICHECIKMDIKSYKIFLYECKGGHKIDNILFNEFVDTQKINISKIKCDKCGKNKGEIFSNIFYKCNECKINLCAICK